MKVIYYSQAFFFDCDLPLIRELQLKGVDVRYFIHLWEGNKKQTILDIKKLKPFFGIYKASDYPEMDVYKEYIDLDKIFFINIPEYHSGIYGYYYRFVFKYFYRWVIFRMRLLHADVFHYTWYLRGWEQLFCGLKCRKIMTVHDPLSHSSVVDEQEEQSRIFSFAKSQHFVLLNEIQAGDFSRKYKVAKDRIFFAKMGEFSFMPYIQSNTCLYSKPYILFFGQISSYKGIEYLCEAMVKIHEKHPKVNLLIAGSGKIYFDFSSYQNLDYIHLENRYLTISEISMMLKNSLFSVCPYKDATQSGVVQTAFSCNTPMIVTNVGALPEAVKDGITGLVVPPCDSEALSEAMDRLLSDQRLQQRFRENIDKVWRPTMAWDSIADKYIEAWRC